MLITILVFILVLSVLILVHEAGHFFVAKFFGVKVEEFGYGFPPRLIGKKIGETIYSLNYLPIGGFVKLFGEDEAGGGRIQGSEFRIQNSEKERAFFAKPWYQKAAIVFAGVVMNFLLAVSILTYLLTFVGIATPGNRVSIIAVIKNSPADISGLKNGDVVLSIDNTKVTSPDILTSYTKSHLGKKLSLKILEPSGKSENISLVPRIKYPVNQGPMGVEITGNVVNKKYPWYQAPFVGISQGFQISWLILNGIGQAITQSVMSRAYPQGVAGPVGIAELTGQSVAAGPSAVLWLMALLSLNLAILNVLPIPALDGGRLFFILIEGIVGRKINPKYESYVHAVGMIALLSLMAFITLHDILNLAAGVPLIPKQ